MSNTADNTTVTLSTLLQGDQCHKVQSLIKNAVEKHLASRNSTPIDALFKEDLPMHKAAKFNNVAMLEMLIKEGLSVFYEDSCKATPLHYACAAGSCDSLQVLVSNGCDMNAQDSYGITPLVIALRNNKLDAAELLLTLGADVNRKAGRGFTPLHYACEDGSMNKVTLLLSHGAQLTRTNARQQNVLFQCTKHATVTAYILQSLGKSAGKMLLARDETTKTVAHYAAEQGQIETLEKYFAVLSSASLSQFVNDKELIAGNTVMHIAVQQQNMDLVKFLTSKPFVDANGENWQGKTPLHLAVECNLPIAQHLLDHGNAKWEPRSNELSLFSWKYDKMMSNETFKEPFVQYLNKKQAKELDEEYFARFVSSPEFSKVVQKMKVTELMPCVSSIKLVRTDKPIVQKQLYMNDAISASDLEYCLSQAMDVSQYKILYEEYDHAVYQSRTYYSLSKIRSNNSSSARQVGNALTKVTGVLQHSSLNHVMRALLSKEFAQLYFGPEYVRQKIDVLPLKNDTDFQSNVQYTMVPAVKPFTKHQREYITSYSLINIPDQNALAFVYKSLPLGHKSCKEDKNYKRGEQLGIYLVYKLDSNRTRYVCIMLDNVLVPPNSYAKEYAYFMQEIKSRSVHQLLKQVLYTCKECTLVDESIFASLKDNVYRSPSVATAAADAKDISKDKVVESPRGKQMQKSLVEVPAVDTSSDSQQPLMKRLTYVSKTSKSFEPDEELEKIRNVAHKFNSSHGVTGLLLYGQGVFYQIIEGPIQQINDLYAKIQLDKRHNTCCLVSEEEGITARMFQDWSLNTLNIEEMDFYSARLMKEYVKKYAK